jgi:hypothetical protein
MVIKVGLHCPADKNRILLCLEAYAAPSGLVNCVALVCWSYGRCPKAKFPLSIVFSDTLYSWFPAIAGILNSPASKQKQFVLVS